MVPESALVACYQYTLAMSSLDQVAHPVADRSSSNKILEHQARAAVTEQLSVPLRTVQQVIGILPAKVLAVLVSDPTKFFGLAALCKQNFDLMGGSGDFLIRLTREIEGGTSQKAQRILLIEKWIVPDDLLEPLRMLASVVILSNVTYGLCLFNLLGVCCRQFSDLRQQEAIKEQLLQPKHVRQVMRYVEIIRRAYPCASLTVDQVVYFNVFQPTIFKEAVALEVKSEAEEQVASPSTTAQEAKRE